MTGNKNCGQSPKAATKPKKPRAPKAKKQPSMAGAAVSTAVKVKGKQTKGLREQGTDLLELVTVDVKKTGVVLQQVVTPVAFPRLGQLARSFQRIRYHRLRFEIITGCPSSTAGVYVAGFVKDARDPVNDTNASATLLASGGEVVKMWQSTEVVVNSLPDLYYTSENVAEQRWSSPGSLVVSLISPPDSQVTIQVFTHWDVSLSQPTYESGAGSTPDSDGFATAELDIYASNDNKYLSVRSGTSWRPMTGADFTPTQKTGKQLRLLGMRFAATENSSQALDGIFGFCRVEVSGSYVFPVDDLGNRSDQNFHGQTYVIAKGDIALIGEAVRRSMRVRVPTSEPVPAIPGRSIDLSLLLYKALFTRDESGRVVSILCRCEQHLARIAEYITSVTRYNDDILILGEIDGVPAEIAGIIKKFV